MKLNPGNEESSTVQVDIKKKRKKTDTLEDEGNFNLYKRYFNYPVSAILFHAVCAENILKYHLILYII